MSFEAGPAVQQQLASLFTRCARVCAASLFASGSALTRAGTESKLKPPADACSSLCATDPGWRLSELRGNRRGSLGDLLAA